MSDGATITVGLLRLTDAAPVIVAEERGFFAEAGLDVRLSVEPSWANIADKLSYGKLDAAVILPPLALAVSLGLRGTGRPLIVPMALSLNGNSISVSNALVQALALAPEASAAEAGARLRQIVRTRSTKLRFAVVHVYSTHNLLLRYWLAAAGIEPGQDVEISVVPPADTTQALRDGAIDGFCAGAPWGAVAARAGVGRTIVKTSEIWLRHPEKCLAVSSSWAAANPASLATLLDAVLAGARYADAPENALGVARILAEDRYLALDPELLRESLPIAAGDKASASHVDRSVFFAAGANFPWPSHAAWFLDQMARWGQVPDDADRGVALEIYRPDLFRAAAARAGVTLPASDAVLTNSSASAALHKF